MSSPQRSRVTVQVFQADGRTPASFAKIEVFKMVPFLWWTIPSHVISTAANVYGRATVWMDYNIRHDVRVTWTGADGRVRTKTEPIIPRFPTWTMTITLPR
jgi:hypothetical protein